MGERTFKMKRKYWLTLPFLSLLCSCTYSSYLMLTGTKKITNKEISASYTKMYGYFGKTFKVKEDYGYHFTFTSTSNEDNQGSLSLKVFLNKIEKNYYEGETLSSLDFSLTEVGKWDVRIIGKNHSGSFSLTWEKVALSN